MKVQPKFDSSSETEKETLGTISPNKLATFANLHQCPQYFLYEFTDDLFNDEEPDRYRHSYQPLSPIYQVIGSRFENAVINYYRDNNSINFYGEENTERVKKDNTNQEGEWEFLFEKINSVRGTEKIVGMDELRVVGQIELWNFNGYADIVFVWEDNNGTIRVKVVELKSGFNKKTSYHIQVGVYAHIIRSWFRELFSNEDEWKVEASIINRESELTQHPKELETISLIPVKNDILNLTKEEGVLHNLYEKNKENINYQLGTKCQSCDYKESCYMKSVEKADTSLIGLSREEQDKLDRKGLSNLFHTASLSKEIPVEERQPGNHINLDTNVEDYDKVHKEIPHTVDTRDVDSIIEHSQLLINKFEQAELGTILPSEQYTVSEEYTWQSGAGYGNLPQHKDNMLRVYLHVEHDHRYDKVCALSASIIVGDTEKESITRIVEVPDAENGSKEPFEALHMEEEQYNRNENQLLTQFTSELFDTLTEISEELGFQDESLLHFYFFAENARDKLIESLERHNDTPICRLWYNLLNERPLLRDEDYIEQQMSSIIQKEISGRWFVSYPTEGLLPVHDIIDSYNSYASWERNGLNLREIFERDCFDYSYDYTPKDGVETGLNLYPDMKPPGEDGYYLPVSGSRIPVEYIWASQDRLNLDWVIDNIRNDDIEVSIMSIGEVLPFIYRDVDTVISSEIKSEMRVVLEEEKESYIDGLTENLQEEDHIGVVECLLEWLRNEKGLELNQIENKDIELLTEQFAKALADIEDSISKRNYDVVKQPVELPLEPEEKEDKNDIAKTLRDYLLMEYRSKRNDNIGYYWKKPIERLRTGRSILAEVEQVAQGDNYIVVKATLPYDKIKQVDDPDYLRNKIRAKSNKGTTSGSWLVANKLKKNNQLEPAPHNDIIEVNNKTKFKHAKYIENGVRTNIQKLDISNNEIMFVAYGWLNSETPFTEFSRAATATDPENKFEMQFEKGDWIMLDPSHDAISSAREYTELNDDNNLLNKTEEIVNSEEVDLSSSKFNTDDTKEIIELLREEIETDGFTPVPPNKEQRNFIKKADTFINLLQGPPGTGKTHTLGESTLARLHSSGKQGENARVAVVGPSHRAVDTVVETIGGNIEYGIEAGHKSNSIDNPSNFEHTLIVRIVNHSFSEPKKEELPIVYMTPDLEIVHKGNIPPSVEYSLQINEQPEEIIRRLTEQPAAEHIVLCGTSSGIKNIIDKVRGYEEEDDDIDLFDLVIADEASMLRLPGLMVPGSEIDSEGQVFISGDQRQMPPVYSHDWKEETRKNIKSLVPYLSTLDYYRLLKGDGITSGDFGNVSIDELGFEPGFNIPMVQLTESYRCSDTTSALLNADIYEKYDGIHYKTADEAERITKNSPEFFSSDYDFSTEIQQDNSTKETPPINTDVAQEILDKDSEIILIQHDENESRQLNSLEVRITEAIIDSLNTNEYSTGVVTPHNSQRSRLQTVNNDNELKADTVERFQGGEEDVIIMNATESDPDYLTKQTEFILNPNRVNVALSRMKYKLIIVASREVFELIPRDIEEYKDAEFWKGIQAALREGGKEWEGSAEELLPKLSDNKNSNANIKIYTGNSPSDIGLNK